MSPRTLVILITARRPPTSWTCTNPECPKADLDHWASGHCTSCSEPLQPRPR